MAGFFNWHVTGMLKQTWEDVYSVDFDAFAKLFQNIPEDTIQQWWQYLRGEGDAEYTGSPQKYVSIATALGKRSFKRPLIVVQAEEDPLNTQPLGFVGATADGVTSRSMFTNEFADIQIYAGHEDAALALSQFVKATVVLNYDILAKSGYVGVEYQGAGPLDIDPEQLPESGGLYARVVRWSSISQYEWEAGSLSTKPPFFANEDITVDGNQGGVTPNRS